MHLDRPDKHSYKITKKKRVLTKRDELSFLTVLALPNASRIGLACNS